MQARADVVWSPKGSIEIGIDSFAQAYRITDLASESLLTDESTLTEETEVFTEFRGATELQLRLNSGDWRGGVRTRLSGGTDLWRGTVALDLRRRSESQRFDLDLEATGRSFREDSDFSLSSDTGELRARAHWRRRTGDFEFGLRARSEMVRYQEQSNFELDNERVDLSLTASHARGFMQSLDLELGLGTRNVADSRSFDAATLFSYDRLFGSVNWNLEPDGRWRFSLNQSFERRMLTGAQTVSSDGLTTTTRHSFWNIIIEPELRFAIDDRWQLRWNSGIEWLDYDRSESVYYDLGLGRTGLALVRRWGSYEASVEPRFSWLRSPVPVEEEYRQPSVVFRFDGFGGNRFFISVSEELGWRDYRDPLDDSLELYSDYWYLRSTILGSFELTPRLALEGFLSDEPESHRRDQDDSRLTLVSASLRLRF